MTRSLSRVCWLAISIGSLTMPLALHGTTLSVDKDAYIRAGSYSGDNFGSDTHLVVKNEGDTNANTREAWLGFDISTLSGTVTHATLRVYLSQVNGTTTHSVYQADSGWTEAGLTWDNQPTSYATAYDSASLTDADDGIWVEYDVTTLVDSLVSSSAAEADFVIAANNNVYSVYDSGEGTNAPELVVTVTTPTVLTPVADAEVRAGTYANTNYGTSGNIEVKNDGATSDNTRAGWLKFDVSGLSGTVSSATLRMYLFQSNGSTTHSVYSATDGWTETGITWNNQPSAGTLCDSVALTDADDGVWVDYDVTSFVAAEVSAGNSAATFNIEANNSVYTKYRSREDTNQPQLIVVTDAGLDSSAAPSDNFDLTHWNITLPVDSSGGYTGTAITVDTSTLTSGYTYSPYFYTASSDGAMTFGVPYNGATRGSSSHPRSELRECNSDGTLYNWLPYDTTGSIHTLTATCVPDTASVGSGGYIAIGQIHGKDPNIPAIILRYYASGRVAATVKDSPTDPVTQTTYDFDTVGTDPTIHYVLQIVGDASGNVDAYLTVNGQTIHDPMSQHDPDWATTTFYFKAGLYNVSPVTGHTAKVGFYLLDPTHTSP